MSDPTVARRIHAARRPTLDRRGAGASPPARRPRDAAPEAPFPARRLRRRCAPPGCSASPRSPARTRPAAERSWPWCARSPPPTARSGGSTTGTSTRSSGSPSRDRRSCASASSPPPPPGELWAGVWGGDPVPGEGPARRGDRHARRRCVLRGVKTFCSGAGGSAPRARAAPAPDGAGGPPLSAWVDLTDTERVRDRPQLVPLPRAAGLRVTPRRVRRPARARAARRARARSRRSRGSARDALRTAASLGGHGRQRGRRRAGRSSPRARPPAHWRSSPPGRILAAQHTISVWLDAAATAMDDAGSRRCPSVALHGARGDRRRVPGAAGRGGPGLRLAPVRARRAAGPRPPRPRGVPAPAPARSDAGPRRRGRDRGAQRRMTSHEPGRLRGALPGADPRPVGLSQLRLRARQVRAPRWPRAGRGRSRRRSSWGPRSASSPAQLAPRCRAADHRSMPRRPRSPPPAPTSPRSPGRRPGRRPRGDDSR